MNGRRTAIVATLGPVSETQACIEGLVGGGLDVVRLSMSNRNRQQHGAAVRLIRQLAAEQGRRVRLLADLQGRKNRIGQLMGGTATWAAGDAVVLTAEPASLAPNRTWITRSWQPGEVRPGLAVLIDDGAVILEVTQARRDELHCQVVEGGPVSDGRGVSIPGLPVPTGLTERDADDLSYALSLGVEMIALSFVASAEDYHAVRALAPDPLIIGKVETPAAVDQLPSLAEAFDGLMVARGDLTVETPFESVPRTQRTVIAECASRGKLSMVATGILHSMRTSLRPTPAEVADVAEAVRAGAGGLVLTGETGYGRHPVHVVTVLRRIIERVEQEQSYGVHE